MANNNIVPTAIVRQLLDKKNYDDWSVQVETYLLAQDLRNFIIAPIPNEVDNAWEKRNAAALHAIQISCSSDTFNVIRKIRWAKEAWDTLATNFSHSSSETESENLINNNPAKENADETGVKLLLEEGQQDENVAENDEEGQNEENFEEGKNEENVGETVEEGQKEENVGETVGNEKNDESCNRFFNNVGKGNWTATQEFIRLHPEAVRVTCPIFSQTALHVAVTFGHLHIVEELVNLMTPQDLEIKEIENDNTAFHIAVEKGNISMAKCMIEKNHNLLRITNSNNVIPIVTAVITGQKRMTRYLYPLTVEQGILFSDNGAQGATLMIECICDKMFDIVFDLVEREPLLLISKSLKELNPVTSLASDSALFPSGCQFKFWQRWIYNCMHAQFPQAINDYVRLNIQTEDNASNKRDITIRFVWSRLLQWMASNFLKLTGMNHIYELKVVHIQSIGLLNRMCKVIETLDEKQILEAEIGNALVEAASRGIIEYVANITKACPKTMWNTYFAFEIFESAVRNREAKVFSLIHGLDNKQAIANFCKSNGNILLHVAGYIANSRKLNLIAGVALQMQREMQWYKEVEAITPDGTTVHFNEDGKRPRELFTENHKDLMIAGETWMKNTSSSCTLVGALIFTIMFTAAFTFPGGNNQNTGFPMFLDKKLFKVFIIFDAISLFSSTTSVLTFLGILTSRYAEEDFLTSLPKKMMIGLSTLFISIAAMMTAFCAVIALLFQSQLWIVIPTILLASIPVILFVGLQFPLLLEIFLSTYGPSIFDRNVGNWIA